MHDCASILAKGIQLYLKTQALFSNVLPPMAMEIMSLAIVSL